MIPSYDTSVKNTEMSSKFAFCFGQNPTGWVYSHLVHHTVRDDETSAVSLC